MSDFKTQWESVGEILKDFTYIFYKVWEMGSPVLTDQVPTACVTFDKDGNHIGFNFNPKFWKTLTNYQRAFVTAHEALHVILNHGVRGKMMNMEVANVAMDVVVNTMLTDQYGFDRTKLGSLSKEGCWLDTVFPNGEQYGQNMEYYYSVLNSKLDTSFLNQLVIVDDHSGFNGKDTSKIFGGGIPKDIQDLLDEAKAGDGQRAGTGTGTNTVEKVQKVPEKQTWVELFQKFAKKNVQRPDEHEQWARLHRRLQLMDPSILIPSEAHDLEVEKPGKIPIWLFLDVSGSCDDYRQFFLKAYKSIPQENFDIRLFSFDTRVEELYEKNGTVHIPYGGGTSFRTIERSIQSLCQKENRSYPKLVLIFTDGYGDKVNPQYPDRWHWFYYTDSAVFSWYGGGYTTSYQPAGSHGYTLDKFV